MMKKDQVIVLLWIALSALAGMALVIYATIFGPGVGGDATIYLTSAKNLLAGQGLGWTEADGSFRLLPYTPPFYPLALSAVGLLTSDLTAGARWLNVFLFGATVAMVGWSFYRATGRPWLAGMLSGLLATSPVIVGVQVWAMSESIFLFTGFSGLLLLFAYLECPRQINRRRQFDRRRIWLLVASSVMVGLALLARYIGVAFVLTGGLALLFLRQRDGSTSRIRDALSAPALSDGFLFGLIASLPTLAWLIIDYSITGTVSSRSAQPASAYLARFVEMGPALQDIFLFWLLPDSVTNRLPGLIQTALWAMPLAGLLGLAVFLYKRVPSTPSVTPVDQSVRLSVLFGLFILIYLIVLAFVQVFTYPPVTLAARMLSPVHLALLVLLFALIHLALRWLVPNRRVITALVYLVALALLGTYALRGALVARDYHQTGIGYNSVDWKNSKTIEVVSRLPEDVPLISNETTALMYLTSRPAYALQEIYQDRPQETFTVYGSGEDKAQQVFRDTDAALVLFESTLYEDFAMYGSQAEERIRVLTQGLFRYYKGEDGAIYFNNRPAFYAAEPCY